MLFTSHQSKISLNLVRTFNSITMKSTTPSILFHTECDVLFVTFTAESYKSVSDIAGHSVDLIRTTKGNRYPIIVNTEKVKHFSFDIIEFFTQSVCIDTFDSIAIITSNPVVSFYFRTFYNRCPTPHKCRNFSNVDHAFNWIKQPTAFTH